MSDVVPTVAGRAARMREIFDRAFAEPRAGETPAAEDLLAIRLGAEPYGLRLAEIAELGIARKITPLFGDLPALLGIAGFRGAIVPVYDLAALLGQQPAPSGRWLALAAAAPIAFALAEFDGHRRVACEAIVSPAGGAETRDHIRDFARLENAMLPIVHLASVLAAIKQMAAARRPRGED